MGGAVRGVAGCLQFLAEVAVRRGLFVAEEVAQVEEAIDAAQEHLELEEHLLATGDLQRADPALPFREVHGPDALRIAHQVEKEILSEAALLHGSIVARLAVARSFSGRRVRVGGWKATSPRAVSFVALLAVAILAARFARDRERGG